MDAPGMNAHILPGVAGLLAGVLLGFAYFGSLWWNTRLYSTGTAVRALTVQVLRLGVLVAALVVLARFGAVALLAAVLGLLLARTVVLRVVGRGP
jgi:F1F0 ATPase subunit 2